MSRSWPSSPLAAAQRAFDLLICPPVPLAFDGRDVAGLPQRMLSLDELKKILIRDATPRPVRDRVWRELVVRARRDGPAWTIVVVGLAMPGLRRAAGRLAKGWHGDTGDCDAELLAGFLDRLATVDVDEPRICGRLIDAGARAVRRAREREEQIDTVWVGGAEPIAPQQPFDHPDWVLARAVAAAVIDPEEHLLIGATRLESTPLQVVAGRLGVSVPVAAAWRRKAERRLVAAIVDGELDRVSLIAAAALRRAVARPEVPGTAPRNSVTPGASGVRPPTGATRRPR